MHTYVFYVHVHTYINRDIYIIVVAQPVVHKCDRNLKPLLCRADANMAPSRKPGCYKCNDPSCIVDLRLHECSELISQSTGQSFTVRHALDCSSRHVIYVSTCNRCHVQGVGKCYNLRKRLETYWEAARDQRIPSNSIACALHKDLTETHSVNDIEFILVEELPARSCKYRFATAPTQRARLEARWIHKLQASLNVKRRLGHFSPGAIAARGAAIDYTS